MNLLDVCVQAGFCQIRSHILVTRENLVIQLLLASVFHALHNNILTPIFIVAIKSNSVYPSLSKLAAYI